MRRILVHSALLAVYMWAVQPRLDAQKQQQFFVRVNGPDGAAVTDLQASDVSVTEDGVPCKILKFEPADWPLKLQVLVDNGKANTNPINNLRDGLKSLFDLIPAGVEMSLYTTSPQPRPIVKPTTDKQKLIEGIGLIASDGGAGAFFDALSEAAERIDKDKTPQFPVILMVGSDFGRSNALDRAYQTLQEHIIKHGITVHIIVMAGGGGTSGGSAQTEIGLAVTKLSGGRYENINSTTRLATLIPEFGKRIVEGQTRQSHQYRISYERPANGKATPQIGASSSRGTPVLSLDGHIP